MNTTDRWRPPVDGVPEPAAPSSMPGGGASTQAAVVGRSELRSRLTGAAQEWLGAVAKARPDGVTAVWDLLAADGEYHAALTQSSRRRPYVPGGSGRGEAEVLRFEDSEETPELSAARAVADVAAGTCDGSSRGDLIQDAVERWAQAHLPAFDASQPFPPQMFSQVDPSSRLFLAEIDSTSDAPFRGFLALVALELLGQRPSVRRCLRSDVRVRVPVLFDRQVTGAVGELRLDILDGGPSGLHPDPAAMVFFGGDEAFADSMRHAWSNSALRSSGECVIWSIREHGSDAPCNVIEHGSLGGAFAVGLHELHRRSHLRGRASLLVLDSRCAVTGGIDERAELLLPVAGYERKLPAARDAKLRRVVVPERSLSEPGFPPAPQKVSVVGAGSVRQAIRRTRNRPNPVYIVASAVIVLLSLVSWLLVSQASAREAAARERAEQENRRTIAERVLSQADSVRSDDPRLALRLGIAAQAVDPDSGYSQTLLDIFARSPISSAIDQGRNWAGVTADGRHSVVSEGTALQTWDITKPSAPRRVGSTFAQTSSGRRVVAAALSPDGTTVAVSTWDGTSASGGYYVDDTVQLWDISRKEAPTKIGRPFSELGCFGTLTETALAFSPDSHQLAVAGPAGAVIWDLTDRDTPRPINEPVPADCALAFSPDGRRLATASGGIHIWDISGPSGPREVVEPTGNEVMGSGGLWFSPDGTKLVVSSRSISSSPAGGGGAASGDPADNDDTVISVLLLTGSDHLSVDRTLPGADAPAVFASDGALFTESDDSGMLLWDLSTGASTQPLNEEPLRGHPDATISMALAPQTGTLVTAGADSALVWRLDSWRIPRMGPPLAGPPGLVFLPGGTSAITGDGEIWDVTQPSHPQRLSSGLTEYLERDHATVSNDGRLLAIAGRQGDDGGVVIWDIRDKRYPQRGPVLGGRGGSGGVEEHVYAVAFSPDGSRLAALLYDEVLLWDVANLSTPRRLPIDTASVSEDSLQFSFDGKLLAGGRQAWDVSAGESPQRVVGPVGRTELLAGPSRKLVEIAGGRATIWSHGDSPRLKRLGTFALLPEGNDQQITLAVSGDGTVMATSSGGGQVLLWDLSDPRAPRQLGAPLTGHVSRPVMAFAPDQGLMVTASKDSVLLWDVSNPESPRRVGQPLFNSNQSVSPPKFSSDGDRLYIQGNFNIALDLSALQELRAQLVTRSCAASGGALTEEEWRRFIGELAYQRTCAP